MVAVGILELPYFILRTNAVPGQRAFSGKLVTASVPRYSN
jgi:hypothetical protein